ncbi:MAG: glycosyltransferase [Thermoplasmata archaeon]|nr:glycosyltransferase [Thermoplasmata archaeon]
MSLPLYVVILVLVGSAMALVYQGAALYFAYKMPRLDPIPSPDPLAPQPKVSIVIAARNEAIDLPGCLDSLLAQDYANFEIIVVDGGSTDGTREVARSKGPRVRVLEEPPLPSGWVGKSWACQAGAEAATGEWILFTDADVRHDPTALRVTVAYALREKADLVTLAPRVETLSFWEEVVMPFSVQMVLTHFRAPQMNRPRPTTALANGQYWLTSRVAYEKIGGHASVKDVIVEDVAIARQYRDAGMTLRIAWAPDLIVTRMYRDRLEMWEGLLKTAHGVEFSAPRQFGLLLGLIAFFWLPLAVLPLGLLSGSLPVIAVGAFLWFALFGKHVAFAVAIQCRGQYGLLYPLAVGFFAALIATSLYRGLRRQPLTWKGRSYAMRFEPRA